MMTLLVPLFCNAQWNVGVVDDGFDRFIVASVMSKDGEAEMNMLLHDGNVVLDLETPEVFYEKNVNDVEMTFKVNGENKIYLIKGFTKIGESMLILGPSFGSIDDIGNLLKGELLNDFKKASAMRLRIYYEPGEKLQYVFNMIGSTSAFYRVFRQK